jgi:hypothetical protein
MNMAEVPPEPTAQQCSDKSAIAFGDEWAFACWYPQMGGYVGKCVVTGAGEGCFDAYVWHDGEFPFGDGPSPNRLHHCHPGQFIAFGEAVLKWQQRWQAEHPDDAPE